MSDASTVAVDLSADQPILIESLCPRCLKNGETTLYVSLSTDRKGSTVVSSFECAHCGNRNNDHFDTQTIKERGVIFTLNVKSEADLSRRVVLTKYASIKIPEVEIEVPPGSPCVTTVEGVLISIIDGLSLDQSQRKIFDENAFQKIQTILDRLLEFKCLTATFVLIVEDPSGNSLIESKPIFGDPHLTESWFSRSSEQSKILGLDNVDTENPYVEEVYSFYDKCPCCAQKCDTRMKQVDIPFFKEVIIMCTSCDHCGYRSNDVKTGGAISEKGRILNLKMTGPEDLTRDILISETCRLRIPEIDLEAAGRSIGGKFTTVEGLLDTIWQELNDKVSLYIGDSSQNSLRFNDLMQKIDQLRSGSLFATLILTDPLSNSYIQNPIAPMPDPNLMIVDYDRSKDENDLLGISAMNA